MSIVPKPFAGMLERVFGRAQEATVVAADGHQAAIIRPERFQPAPTPDVPAPKKKKKRGIVGKSALALVVLPTLLGAIYYGLIASNQFSADFQLAIRSNDRQVVPEVGLALPGMGGSSPMTSDSYIAVEYLRSRQLVEDISKKIDLRGMYRRQGIDLLSRLGADASVEDVVEYWKKHIDTRFDSQTGIITASVRSFDPQDSLLIARSALDLANVLVNELSRKARDEALASAEGDVKRAELRMATAVGMLKKFRDRTGVIDPAKGAQASLEVMGRLNEELVRQRAQLSILVKNMSPTALPIINLRQRIAAIEEQIRYTRADVSKSGADSRTPELSSQLLSEFEQLELERQFSEKSYTVALASLERARSEAVRTQRYLSVFVEPQMPEDSTHPRRALMIVTIALFSFIAWAVFLLSFMTVKEHVT